jgi:hypothetical protein
MIRPIPALSLVLAAGLAANCRTEPRPGRSADTATRPPTPIADVPAAPAAPVAEEIVPPIPSNWRPGTTFQAPPPVQVSDVNPYASVNFLSNPSFEEGPDPWWYFPDRSHWGGYTLARGGAAGGDWSARLDLIIDATHPPPDKTHIRGVIQDVRSPVFPQTVRGAFFVDEWTTSGTDTYMQFVVIVTGAAPPGQPQGNTQIRYLLAGIDHPPFGISNAKFFYVTREAPPVGVWVPFERDLPSDFREMWGFVPERFETVRVLFEVRYDNVDPSNPPTIRARVRFDELFLGT